MYVVFWRSELSKISNSDKSFQTHAHISPQILILTRWLEHFQNQLWPCLEIISDLSPSTTFLPFLYFQSGKLVMSGHNKIWAKVEPEFWFHLSHTFSKIKDKSTLWGINFLLSIQWNECNEMCPDGRALWRPEHAMHMLVSMDFVSVHRAWRTQHWIKYCEWGKLCRRLDSYP